MYPIVTLLVILLICLISYVFITFLLSKIESSSFFNKFFDKDSLEQRKEKENNVNYSDE